MHSGLYKYTNYKVGFQEVTKTLVSLHQNRHAKAGDLVQSFTLTQICLTIKDKI